MKTGKDLLILLLFPALISCKDNIRLDYRFTIDHINGYTPVKDQGRSQVCWIYAMLSTIETSRLALGDSVNLSPYFVARSYYLEQAGRYYDRYGRKFLTSRATALTAVRLLQQYGLMPYDSYHHGKGVNLTVLADHIRQQSKHTLRVSKDKKQYIEGVQKILDKNLGSAAPHVYMLGAQYTYQEFARSVCAPDEYVGYTSFAHKPFYSNFVLEVPDNYDDSQYYNLPIDELVDNVRTTVKNGGGVCWEGDVSEPGFSFKDGIAVLSDGLRGKNVQDLRQREFENTTTTDDHCMAVVGLAHDDRGTEYFIMKNSWGKSNPYNGLMYMSVDYFKLKTIAVVMPKVSHQNTNHQHLQDPEQYIYLR